MYVLIYLAYEMSTLLKCQLNERLMFSCHFHQIIVWSVVVVICREDVSNWCYEIGHFFSMSCNLHFRIEMYEIYFFHEQVYNSIQFGDNLIRKINRRHVSVTRIPRMIDIFFIFCCERHPLNFNLSRPPEITLISKIFVILYIFYVRSFHSMKTIYSAIFLHSFFLVELE